MKKNLLIVAKGDINGIGGIEVHCRMLFEIFSSEYIVRYISVEEILNRSFLLKLLRPFSIVIQSFLLFFYKYSLVNNADLIIAQEYTGAFLPKSKTICWHHISQKGLMSATGADYSSLGARLLYFQRHILERLSFSNRRVICVSNRVLNELQLTHSKVPPPTNIDILNNPVPYTVPFKENVFKKPVLSFNSVDKKKKLNVLVAGRNDDKWKGFDLIKLMLKDNRSLEHDWTIFTNVSKGFDGTLSNVKLNIGFTQEEVVQTLHRADIVLMPSRYEGDSFFYLKV